MSLLLFPNMLCQGGFIHLCLIFERTDMIIRSIFKISFCSSYVNFTRVTRCSDYTFINYVFSVAFPLQRTIFFFSTVAWLRMTVDWINEFLDVWSDNIFHILCVTVAYLHIIPIGNAMELARRWKMQIYQLKELLCNVCNECTTIRQVKPYDVTVALSFYMTFARFLERQTIVTVTTIF